MPVINPVLLAGGSGTRLWPLSRKSYPKQFSKFIGDATLYQNCANRLLTSDIVEFGNHITLTVSNFRFIVAEQLREVGIEPGPILIEPEAKNTAASILAASIFLHSKDENAVVLVAPSDHIISNTHDFHKAINTGLSCLEDGNFVTFGIEPTRPETGYGYLEISREAFDTFGPSAVLQFVEKPNLDQAQKFLAADNFLWNAGIYLFRAKDLIVAFGDHAPDTLDLVTQSVYNATLDLGLLRLDARPWAKLVNNSIDYAIMEKVQNLVAVPYKSKWSDLGGWDAVWSENNPDSAGNVVSETAHAIDCKNSLIRSECRDLQIVAIGLDNIMAIAMPDAVLVADKDRAQDVKKAVSVLKAKDIAQSEIFPKDHRPWGWFESLVLGDGFQVKRISVAPGAALSLQSHKYRSEHWIVVQGTAKVTIGDDVELVAEGQSVFVPLGEKHRLENPGKKNPIILIEVQIGDYLGEDDIVRYSDVYSRIDTKDEK